MFYHEEVESGGIIWSGSSIVDDDDEKNREADPTWPDRKNRGKMWYDADQLFANNRRRDPGLNLDSF